MAMPPINWQEIMRMYNEEKGTNYKDIRTFLFDMHEARSNMQNDELLGVSHMSFAKQLIKHGIPAKTKGYRRHRAEKCQ